MKSTLALGMALLITQAVLALEIRDTLHQDRAHYVIETTNGIYLFDRAGGGFSSLVDPEGLEWIGFRPGEGKVPESAAADFRGMPNLVFRGEDNGAGHPGFDQCISQKAASDVIHTVSRSGLWEWQWTFRPDHVLLEVIRTDTSRACWYLYEGTPGGVFDPPKQFWGNNLDGTRYDRPAIGSPETAHGQWRWVYFGHIESPWVLFLVHLDEDGHNDTFSYMGASEEGIRSGDGMVVFGFGRKGGDPLMRHPGRFLAGLIQMEAGSDPYPLVKRKVEQLSATYLKNPIFGLLPDPR
jgi:hypothetical protein